MFAKSAVPKLLPCFVSVAPLVLLYPIIDAVPDDQDQWLHRVSGGKLSAAPMSELGFDLDDDIQFVSRTRKRKELSDADAEANNIIESYGLQKECANCGSMEHALGTNCDQCGKALYRGLELPPVQLPAKRARSQQQAVVPQLVVPLEESKTCSAITQKFRDWDAKNQNNATTAPSGQPFTAQGLKQSVDIPLQPLDASTIPAYHDGISYYSLVLPIVQQYRNLFTEDGVTVLPELKSMMVGLAKQDQWLRSTQPNSSSGRHYNDELFCKADIMAWVYNVTDFRMARQLEDDAMLAISNVFGFVANRDPSAMHRKSVSDKLPHAGYFMAIRQYIGTQEQFIARKDDIQDDPSVPTADLGKRFKHPFGWRT